MADLSGVLTKLDNPTLGQALGFVLTEMQYDRSHGWGLFQTLMFQIEGAMTQPHFPDLQHVIADLMSDNFAGKVFKSSIAVGLAGWILDEIDMNPKISQIGKLMKTLGFNAAIGSTAVVLFDDSTRGFSDGADHGLEGGSHFSFKSGSSFNPHGRFTEVTHSPRGTNLTRSAASSAPIYP